MTRKEAVEVYNGLINEKIKAAFEFFAPELRESEDERIRKALIDLANDYLFWDTYKLKKEQVLAYLEKQKEQIPYIDFVIKPHKGDDNNPYDMRVSEAQEYAIKRGFGVPFNDGEVYVDERHITQTIGNILRWADDHPKEQKPAWSEEDEKMIRSILFVLESYVSKAECEQSPSLTATYPTYYKEIAWLKSFRPQPQKLEDWTEEDERLLGDVLGCITLVQTYKACGDLKEFKMGHTGEELRSFIRSLKSRPRKQPHWKPSEAQMEALKNSAYGFYQNGDGPALRKLYEQLQKLKGGIASMNKEIDE